MKWCRIRLHGSTRPADCRGFCADGIIGGFKMEDPSMNHATAPGVRQPLPIGLMIAAAFFSACALRVCDPLVPQLAREFELTPGTAGLVIVGFSIAYGLMQLVYGPLGDRFGKPLVMTGALFFCAVAAGMSAMGHNFAALVVGRILWGMAAAGVIPLAMAWIGDAIAYEQRQTTLARFLTGTLTGMFAGQFMGGLFADSPLGWRAAFLTLSLGYLLMAVLLWQHLRRIARLPLSQPPVSRGAGIGSIGEVLATPWARVVLLAVFVEGVCLLGPLGYVPTYLHQRFGLSLTLAAGLTALHALGGLSYALSARVLVARLGERRMALSGGLMMGAGFALWWLTPHWALAGLAAWMAGFGTYLYHNTLQTHATQMTPHVRGSSLAMFAFCLFGGQALGTWLCGLVIDAAGPVPMLVMAMLALPLAGWGFAGALGRREAARATAG
jgi:predicted MFS family arabinose efflux permease